MGFFSRIFGKKPDFNEHVHQNKRKRAGKTTEPKSKHKHITLTPTVNSRLDAVAEAKGISVNEWIADAVNREWERLHQEENTDGNEGN